MNSLIHEASKYERLLIFSSMLPTICTVYFNVMMSTVCLKIVFMTFVWFSNKRRLFLHIAFKSRTSLNKYWLFSGRQKISFKHRLNVVVLIQTNTTPEHRTCIYVNFLQHVSVVPFTHHQAEKHKYINGKVFYGRGLSFTINPIEHIH